MTEASELRAAAAELRWAGVVAALISLIMVAIITAGVVMHINPPSNTERIDPQQLHLSSEFTEGNLGVRVEANGQIVARLVATQFAFVPHCLELPADRPVVLRVTSPDVIHGLLVTGTNVNTMVVPGYVSQVHTVFRTTGDLLMPCHEFCGLGHSEMTAVVRVVPPEDFHPDRMEGSPVPQNKRLILAHLWVAFAAFAVACALGVWQMWVRSPLAAPLDVPARYYQSVTAHGVSMAYVLTTFFIMGFGYFTAETALKAPLPGRRWAWSAFALAAGGTAMTVLAIVSGRATVLYTFYPPLTATIWFYLGLVMVVVASWIWCVLMLVAMAGFKRRHPGVPVPLAMYATVANAVMWLWTTVGVATEILFLIAPAALGWRQTIDVGLSRTLFSWTLHAIVYFWLFPAYIAFYTMAPRAAGGRLYSDIMGRLSFVLFLLYSLPVGMHHLFMDPEHSTGFKFVQMSLTALVSAPTLLTVFTITASMELAGRLRGGTGLLGWVKALPWERPMVLATGLAFFMLWFGGGGGLVNMSYGMNAMVHNTSWVTAHFHLIFGGSVVLMYFAIAYDIWPCLTGRAAPSAKLQRLQLVLWTLGMMVMTLPWHALGLAGQWRRVASFDYADPRIAAWGPWVDVSLAGGVILFASALLFIFNLLPRRKALPVELTYAFALAAHPPQNVPAALNGFGVWNLAVAVLMAVAYGFPIAQFFLGPAPQAVVHRLAGG